jgi:4-diphosphocytidyl-2-C-methyl-D-erythritol kinase
MQRSDLDYWLAPAKLNRFLHVTGRRADGYHTLQTLFQFLDFADRLQFEITDNGTVQRCSDDALPAEDLCVRAARLLQSYANCKKGVNIYLQKNLPCGSGLGGGSSDAATTLIALNSLWKLGLDRVELQRLGVKLGADVPVFVFGHACWAEGIGDYLQKVELEEEIFCVIWPKIEVSTAKIFSDQQLTRNSLNITIRDFLEGNSRNDLEVVTRRLFPRVNESLVWLSNYGDARMTGSGSACFVQAPSYEFGQEVLSELPDDVVGFVARSLNRHPLLKFTSTA